jgi:hypothetical protein
MTTQFVPLLDPPRRALESALIDECFRLRGLDPYDVQHRTDRTAAELRKEAVTYAAMKLTEIEARAHYVEDVHGVRTEVSEVNHAQPWRVSSAVPSGLSHGGDDGSDGRSLTLSLIPSERADPLFEALANPK